ncbi:MAG: DNA-binding protein WhiA [Eubacteriaceae bacterium]|jgi:DNA-binding protein WhiA|nr:DNA-binding protein WhiA [Eubacteriaceae bacterium]
MRFHEEIKSSLSLCSETDISEAEAALYGVFAASLPHCLAKGGQAPLSIRTPSASMARYVFRLLDRAFVCKGAVCRSEIASFGEKAEYTVEVSDSGRVAEILRYYGMDLPAFSIQKAFLAERSSRQAFMRGLFLACGYCTDPQNAYLIEFRLPDEAVALALKGVFSSYGVEFRLREKSRRHILYAKNSECYATTLALIGANSHYLKAEGSLAMKAMKNKMKRAVNCDTANINKSVESSLRQVEAIHALMESGRYGSLGAELKTAAELRLGNELGSLSELASDSSGSVTKSTLSRRLNKIVEISKGKV